MGLNGSKWVGKSYNFNWFLTVNQEMFASWTAVCIAMSLQPGDRAGFNWCEKKSPYHSDKLNFSFVFTARIYGIRDKMRGDYSSCVAKFLLQK